MAGVMAASMLAPGMSAFAAEGDIVAKTGLKINKTIEVGDGITIPSSTISFKAHQVDKDTTNNIIDNADGTEQGKVVNDVTISFDPSAVTLESVTDSTNKYYLKDFSELEAQMTENGEYTFELTENDITSTKTEAAGYGWTKDNGTFYLHAYVSDKADGTGKLYEYLVTSDNTLGEQSKKKTDGANGTFKFTNKYTTKGGVTPPVNPDPDPINPDGGDDNYSKYSLAIAKAVDGNNPQYADEFEFTVTFASSTTCTVDNTTTFKYAKLATTTTVGDNTDYSETLTNGGKIKLKNGQKAVFQDIPAGLKVTVVESKEANTTAAKVESWMNGATSATTQNYTQTDSSWTTDTSTGTKLTIGQARNTIRFTNTYKDVTPTGVVTSVAPYITLVVVAVAAVAAYVAMKARVAR